MVLAVLSEANPPVVRQRARRLGALAVSRPVVDQDVIGNLLEPDPPERGCRSREAGIDHLGAEAEGLEDLRAAIGREGRDPHLGQDLEQALFRRGAELEPRLRRAWPGRLARIPAAVVLALVRALVEQRVYRGNREPRVDRFGAVPDQRGVVMDVDRVARLGHQPHPRAQAPFHQVLPHSADREQHRDRRAPGTDAPIADDEDVRAPPHRPLRGPPQAHERRPESIGSGLGVPDRIDRDGRESRHVVQRGHLVRQHDRMFDPQHAGVARSLEQGRAPAPEMHAQRHHHRLAKRIDRGIGHLREALAKIGVDALRKLRERGNRRVVAHAPHGVGAGTAHGLEHVPEVLETVAEPALKLAELLGLRGGRHPRRVGLEPGHVARHPAGIGPPSRDLELGVEIADDLPAPGVHQEHLSRPHLPALDHVRGIEIQQAHLGPCGHQAIAPDLVATRAKAVAIDDRAGHDTVGERHCRGPIPRLVHALVILVEGFDGGVQVGILLPRLRDHHHEGVDGVPTGSRKQLHRVVQAGRVAALLPDHLPNPIHLGAPERRIEQRLPHGHGVSVAPQRIDLAVVGQQPERLR